MKRLLLLFISLILLSDFIFAQGRVAKPAAKPAGPVIDEKGIIKTPGKDKPGIALDVRLLGSVGIPLGSLSTIGSGVGGGGHLDVEFKLPLALGPLQLKLGLTGGFYGMGLQPDITTVSATISLVPILGYVVLAYPIKSIRLTPYLGVGGGGTVSAYDVSTTSQSADSFDGTLGFRVGAEYSLPPVPKLSIILNASYNIIFEADSAGAPNHGQLLSIELGASYRILGN